MDDDAADEHAATGTSANAGTSAAAAPVMAINAGKAGMEGIDVAAVNAVIEEASKGSKFYKAKEQSNRRVLAQADRIRDAARKLTPVQIAAATREADKCVATLTSTRDLSRTVVHVDMDAFYAAVEMRDQPQLKDVPMAVGSNSMLSTSNYLARKFGVRAGMPGFIGKKLCPDLVLVPLNFDKYRAVSEVVRDVFRVYDPDFCPMSLDEAYLDITDYLKAHPEAGSAEDAVNTMRGLIRERTDGLTASAGIAPNAMLAKICSDRNKPDGQFRLEADERAVMDFIRALPVRKVSGIGGVTEQLLSALDITTCAHLFERRGELRLLFSEISSAWFLRVALGIGSTKPSEWAAADRKSRSTETTFRDTSDAVELAAICSRLSADLAADLRKEGLRGRAVTLKIKTHTFRTQTRVRNLLEFTSEAEVIESAAKALLKHFAEAAEEKPLRLRLMGVRMSDFKDEEAGVAQGQKRIDAFLCGKGNPEQNFSAPCPICSEVISTHSENAFNAHLDSCLNKSEMKDASVRRRDECADDASAGLGSAPTPSAQSLVEGARERQTTASAARCPVCQRAITASDGEQLDAAVDTHLDECLSRAAIRDGQADLAPPAAKRPKQTASSRPPRGIESYFGAASAARNPT